MRAGIGLAVALAVALAGCKALGFTEQSTRDWSVYTTKAGTYLDLDAPQKVKVVRFEQDFKSSPPRALVTLRNEASVYEVFSVDVEFGYQAPAGSFAPYTPDFTTLDLADFKGGTDMTLPVFAPAGHADTPLFARILASKGSDVRMTVARESSDRGLRRGTTLLGNRVEVVKMEGNLVPREGEKPTLSFTIENVSKEEIGSLRYMVQFYKDGKLMDLGRRVYSLKSVGKPLGKLGDKVTIDVTGLEAAGSLAGAKPVLRVTL